MVGIYVGRMKVEGFVTIYHGFRNYATAKRRAMNYVNYRPVRATSIIEPYVMS
jgi:hypothetical protein